MMTTRLNFFKENWLGVTGITAGVAGIALGAYTLAGGYNGSIGGPSCEDRMRAVLNSTDRTSITEMTAPRGGFRKFVTPGLFGCK